MKQRRDRVASPMHTVAALGIPVSAGVLYPFYGLLLSILIAGAGMATSRSRTRSWSGQGRRCVSTSLGGRWS